MTQQFLLSVVIPIYNAEQYLEETIKNVISQTLNFQENIQLVLVNDCSKDNSELICMQYQKSYPDNVEYLCCECNEGVSVARNKGKSLAKGKYITFLDADDLWSDNAFEQAVNYLEENAEKIDFVSGNVVFFEEMRGNHILNIDLKQNIIMDMYNDYRCIRTNCVACIFKYDAVKDIFFDERQTYWEDAKFIYNVLLKKMKYGMLADVTYFYRKRGDSLTHNFQNNLEHYINDLEILFNDIYEYSVRATGDFPEMMKVLMAYVIAYRFTDNVIAIGQSEEKYGRIIRKILNSIDDIHICNTINASKHVRLAMLSFKYGYDVRKEVVFRQKAIYFRDVKVFDLQEGIISIWSLEKQGNTLQIEGRLSFDILKEHSIYVEDNSGKRYNLVKHDWLGCMSRKSFQKEIWVIRGYSVQVPDENTEKLFFVLEMDGNKQKIPFKYFDAQTGKAFITGTVLESKVWIAKNSL